MGTRTYGHDKTIHRNEEVNVELDDDGKVVAVWFRCTPLPFTQGNLGPDRAKEMRSMYARGEIPALVAVELRED